MNTARFACLTLALCFCLTLPSQAAPLTVLASFPGVKNGGAYPEAPLLPGSDGAFYGTTAGGGTSGYGAIYRLFPDSSSPTGYTLRFLWYFDNTDGRSPMCRLVEGPDGSFYGTTQRGGARDDGTVFRLAPDSSAPTGYTLHTLHSFSGSDGQFPTAGLSSNNNGVFTGTTLAGGSRFGTVYRLTPNSSAPTGYDFSTLYDFNGTDGNGPDDTPIIQNGLIYGETAGDNNSNYGTIYRLSPDASAPTGYSLTTLYAFTGGTDGGHPQGNLRPDGSGGFFSVASYVGYAVYVTLTSFGTVFHLVPDASAATGYALHTLYTFHGPDGFNPIGVTLGADGSLYGANYYGGTNYFPVGNGEGLGSGTTFKLSPDASSPTGYALHTLRYFANPAAAPLLLSDGLLYGVEAGAGTSSQGSIYRIDPNGQNAPVSISSLSPATVRANTAFTLTVIGSGFSRTSTVEWNGLPQPPNINGTSDAHHLVVSITAATNGNLLQYPGTATISVVNPDAGTATKPLTITAPVPQIASLSPASVPAGHPGFTLTVNGNGFVKGEKVRFSNTNLNAAFVSPTQLTTFVPANLLTAVANVPLSVINLNNGDTSGTSTFPVTFTALSLSVGTITRDKSTHLYSIPLMLTNTGYRTAAAGQLTFAEIISLSNRFKHEDTNVPLPLDMGTLAPGDAYHVTLTFSSTAITYPSPAVQVKGTYTNGTFNDIQAVTLP